MIKRCSLSTPPKRILVISMRHLGDVLLCTPLLTSLRRAYPQAKIDALVYSNTAAMLKGNPDVDHLIGIEKKPSGSEYITLVKKIVRKYDLAVITQTGDRPLIYGLYAASTRIALTPRKGERGWWKRFLVSGWAEFDDINTHTVLQSLQLMDVLQKPKCFALTAPANVTLDQLLPFKNYAVLHIYPLWTYKQWTLQGWKQVAQFLLARNIDVVLSGGPAEEEIDFIKQLHQKLPSKVVNLAGKTSLSQLAYLITNARLYIGPDTGTTHLAAATGTPTVAIFGPTNPVKWAPWPTDYQQERNPFSKIGNQHINNVYLIQGKGDCVPCHQEGCDRHRKSRSQCLDRLLADEVNHTIAQILSPV